MKTWTVLGILNWTSDFFKEKGLKSYRFDAEYLISYVLNFKRIDLYLNFDIPVSVAQRETIKFFIHRRVKREPLQYIVSETEFYGLKFKVNPSVLIPRPETEHLVEIIVKDNKNVKILDIGSGSGAISIALAKFIDSSFVTGVDISEKAIEIAKENGVSNNVENVEFIVSDLYSDVNEKFDIIVSNPPYISHYDFEKLDDEIRLYEPRIALEAAVDGIFFYKKILESAKKYLNPDGKIYFEIGYNQKNIISKLAIDKGFEKVETFKDYNDFDRYMIIR